MHQNLHILKVLTFIYFYLCIWYLCVFCVCACVCFKSLCKLHKKEQTLSNIAGFLLLKKMSSFFPSSVRPDEEQIFKVTKTA